MKRVMCTIWLVWKAVRYRIGLLLCFVLFIFSGCDTSWDYSSIDALVAEWAEEDRTYDEKHNIKYRVDRWNNPLVFGMTTQEVYEKWGTATKDVESFSALRHLLVWKYGESWGRFGNYFPADTYLYFLDNRLIRIVKTR